MSFPGIKEISILLTNLKSFIIDSSLALSILATPFRRDGERWKGRRKTGRARQAEFEGEGWKRGCKRTEWRAETKTKAPSTLGCPIERIDASASEIFSKELTPLSPPGINALPRSSFLSSARSALSFYHANALGKLLLSRNSAEMAQ